MYRKLKFLVYFFVFSAWLSFLFILLLYKGKTEDGSYTVPGIHGGVQEDLKTYPRPWTLIDIQLQYLINNLVCHDSASSPFPQTTERTVFMIILITSHAGDVETREKIREILPQKQLDRLQMKRIFLLAKPPSKPQPSKYPSVTIRRLQEENEEFRDILMGNFQESYHNLTYKHLMGLEWIDRYCSHATFILKQDDDVIVDFYQLSALLKLPDLRLPLLQTKSIFGKVLANYNVVRDLKSKWFVSKKEFADHVYPAFVSGWAYVTTPAVVKDLVKSASQFHYFWIDDVHITGTIREFAKIELIDMDKYFTPFKGHLQCCIATSAYSKFNTKQPYWCDFVVGPSNGDTQLMEIFQNHSRFCHTSKMCLRRSEEESLNSTCVITDKMVVNNFRKAKNGQTNKGMWKQMKL